MSFKEFVASHTGRRFFDTFQDFVAGLQEGVVQLTALVQTMRSANNVQEQALARMQACIPHMPSNDDIKVIPDEALCVSCGQSTVTAVSLTILFQGTACVMCMDCAQKKEVLNGPNLN
jgi:hypothetical protein